MPRNKQGKFVKKTIAQKVRELNEKGMSRVEIAKTLGIRYQRVRNVLVPRVKPVEFDEQEEAEEAEFVEQDLDMVAVELAPLS
jgi:orotate phosphoribosyltransferase-like protein